MIIKLFFEYSPKKQSNETGFTILEVLMSLVFFAVGIIAIAGMQATSIEGNNIAGKYTQGANLGISEIEKIIATAYDDATLNDNATGTVTQGIYTVNWTVSESVPIESVKNINMVVTWNVGDDQKTFTANYYKAVTY